MLRFFVSLLKTRTIIFHVRDKRDAAERGVLDGVDIEDRVGEGPVAPLANALRPLRQPPHVVVPVDVADDEARRTVQRDAHAPDVALRRHARYGTDGRHHVRHLSALQLNLLNLLTFLLVCSA